MPDFSRPPLGFRYWPGWCLVGLIYVSHILMPRSVRCWFGRGLGALAWYFNRSPRHVAMINLERCLPDLKHDARVALLKEHFKLMGQGVWDYPLAWFGSRRRLAREIVIDGLEHLQRSRAMGLPVILMVAHTAALDMAPPRLAMEMAMAGPYNPFDNKLANWLIQHGRCRFGNSPISRDSGLRGLVRALRGGGILYYLADEDYGRERSVFVPFFGHDKATLPIIGRLASAGGATVLPTMTVYDKAIARYRVIIDPPLENFPTGNPTLDARCMNEALESQIARYPAHYLWTLKLFRTRPKGEADWY